MLEDFLDQFSRAHGSELVNLTDDIVGFPVTPNLESIVPNRKQIEIPLILSQAVDPTAEDSSCRDLARLVDHSMAAGKFCHAICEPRIGLGDAASRLRTAAPGGAGPGDGAATVRLRSFALLNFRFAFRHLQEEVTHPTFVFDLETGERAQEVERILHSDHPWESGPASSPAAVRRALTVAYDTAGRELDDRAAARLAEIRSWLQEQEKSRQEVMESYFDELAKELEEERRSVYYHLYFFEKEQEIEEKIRRIEDERRRRRAPATPPIQPSCTVDLVNAGIFEVPFAGWASGKQLVEVDLLEGRLIRSGGAYSELP